MSGPSTAWKAGYDHRSYGGRYIDNPYEEGTIDYWAWCDGYRFAKDVQYIWAYTA